MNIRVTHGIMGLAVPPAIWIEILHVSCMYLVCITLLNVEYNTHTYTYMPHTGICNLIHSAI
jgi:hypothetical protein